MYCNLRLTFLLGSGKEYVCIKILSYEQNGRDVADHMCKVFLADKLCILIRMLLTFAPANPTDYMATLAEVMVWRLKGGKPLPQRIPNKMFHAILSKQASMS